MQNDLGLELDNLEVVEDSPSSEGEFERTERIFKKSLEVVQKAMENVVQEMLIQLGDESHMVYITKLDISPNGEVAYDFAVLDESKREDLIPHIENCIKIQIQQAVPKKKLFSLF